MKKSKNTDAEIQGSRRDFLSKTALASVALPLLPGTISGAFNNTSNSKPLPMNAESPKVL
ncbi:MULTISPECIES: twin-arginine translocation signal domain-containing protein [Arenibacter]|uniref:twin-arginine translocation signal domain-containing protein n=1 Tax=Arenibacter TaxID=178469 RepID=UPI0018DB9816|nr:MULTISPECIES: twin-arginine translocation signal domain-containing protein [Arenibacter]